MEVQVDPKLLRLVESQSENIVKALNEALKLWLEQKLITCPITKRICTNNQIPCNECSTFTKIKKLRKKSV
jgi:hypothetical protein